MISLALFILAALLAVAGCGYLVAGALLVGRFARQSPAPLPASWPGVTVLKPLHGAEPGLYDNLASFCMQDYAGPVQRVFGLADANDGAVAVVEALRHAHPATAIELAIDPRQHGTSGKVSNLINMAPRIRHEVVLIADADMRVGSDYLERVVAALAEPGAGAVTCLYQGVGVAGVWAELAALGINAHFLPSITVGLALGLAQPCFGATIAMRRDALAAIGGFEAFADTLADDYAIGRAMRASGRAVRIPPLAPAHMCTQASLGELWRQELRWARTIRSIDPVGFAGSLVAHPLAWALIAMAFGAATGHLALGIILVVAALACRLALLAAVARAFRLSPQAYWLVPLRDLFSFAVFVASFCGRAVRWKGRDYRVAADGRLVAKGEGAP